MASLQFGIQLKKVCKRTLQPLTITMRSTSVHTMAALVCCIPVSCLQYPDCY